LGCEMHFLCVKFLKNHIMCLSTAIKVIESSFYPGCMHITLLVLSSSAITKSHESLIQ
jgi:hypothetical protein